MKKIIGIAVASFLVVAAQQALAIPHKKKKSKKPTHKSMQKHLNRTLSEKGFTRFRDSLQKK